MHAESYGVTAAASQGARADCYAHEDADKAPTTINALELLVSCPLGSCCVRV